jgi:hypothetical protein
MDIIKWIDDLIAALRFGVGKRIDFEHDPGVGVERMLRNHGVRVYGRGYMDKTKRSLRVQPQQEQWARYLIARQAGGGKMPRRHAKTPRRAVGLAGRIVDWLSE